MPVRTNEPRLPLEPEEYPLYKPPRRFGCSGLTIVTLLTMGVFALLMWKVTPDMAKAITDLPRAIFKTQATVEATRGPGALQTAVAQPTRPPIVIPTPVILYVQVGNNSGQLVRMRSKPSSTSTYQVSLKGGEILQVISKDETDSAGNVWRQVQLLCNDGRKGWILEKFLLPDAKPPACGP